MRTTNNTVTSTSKNKKTTSLSENPCSEYSIGIRLAWIRVIGSNATGLTSFLGRPVGATYQQCFTQGIF